MRRWAIALRPSIEETLASVGWRVFALAVFTMASALPATAQSPAAQNTTSNERAPPEAADEPQEEIVVRGRRTLNSMRQQIDVARERVYELFNAYNSDDAFDIRCSEYTRPNSRLKERVCEPRYFIDATSRAGREVAHSLQVACLGANPPPCPEQALAFENAASLFQQEYQYIPAMNARLEEEMRRLEREQPEVAAAIAEFRAKTRAYREELERRRRK